MNAHHRPLHEPSPTEVQDAFRVFTEEWNMNWWLHERAEEWKRQAINYTRRAEMHERLGSYGFIIADCRREAERAWNMHRHYVRKAAE